MDTRFCHTIECGTSYSYFMYKKGRCNVFWSIMFALKILCDSFLTTTMFRFLKSSPILICYLVALYFHPCYNMFISSCKRPEIMKGSDAIGLEIRPGGNCFWFVPSSRLYIYSRKPEVAKFFSFKL